MTSGSPPETRWGVTYFHRRKYPRVGMTLPVEYRIVAEPASPKVPAAAVRPGPQSRKTRSRSLGAGGLLIETAERLVIGTRLALTLHLPGPARESEAIECAVRVVWTDILSDLEPDEYKCGVEFLEIGPEVRERVVAFVRAHLIQAV